jgi:hypothetical protein
MFRALNRLLFPPLPGRSRPHGNAHASARLPADLSRWLDGLPRYEPLSSRQRRLMVPVLALLTSGFILFMMLERPGAKPAPESWFLPNPGTPNAAAAEQAAARAAGPQRCLEGQTQGCVGGRAQVFVVPAPARAP